jgi:pyruvate/2-oxoglutarate/acetoin dehydrogenase E1 component
VRLGRDFQMFGKDRLSRAALFAELLEVRQIVAVAFRTICRSIHKTLRFQMVADIFGRQSAGVQIASHPAGDVLRITRWGQIHDTG